MVKQDAAAHTTRRIFVIDIESTGVSVTEVRNRLDPSQHRLSSLPSSLTADEPSTMALWAQFTKEFAEKVLAAEVDIAEAIFIFGCSSDPFAAAGGNFAFSLRVVEYLAKIGPRLFCVQTRSPLVLLALPVLSSPACRTAVVFYLESRSDKVNAAISAYLPRPSERLQAIRALKRSHVHTILHVAAPQGERALGTFALILSELGLPVVFAGEQTAEQSGSKKPRHREQAVLQRYYNRAHGPWVTHSLQEILLNAADSTPARLLQKEAA